MLRKPFAVGVALASLAVVEPAHAQTAVAGFGAPGQFIVSAERLFGLHFWSVKTVPDVPPMNMNAPATTRDSGTAINFLFGSDTAAVGNNGPIANVPVYAAPQLGLDYILGPGITVGASLGYLHRGASRETTAVNNVVTSRDLPSGHAFLFHPRAGYVFDFTPLLAVWARGGITYFYASSEGLNANGTVTTRIAVNGFALSLDPELVITPLPHLGVTVGPMLDLPLSGGSTTDTTVGAVTTSSGSSYKVTNYGIAAGVLAYF